MKIAKLSKLSQATAKKLLISFITLIFAASLTIFLVSAETTATPSINTPTSPVDAEKATITGTTEPNAKVVATGGPYQIPPIYADSNGDFEITVALAQETTNIFFVYAQDGDSDISESVQVTIIESEAQTQAYEESTGEDRTAPDAPEISPTEIETDELTYTIEGSGEAGASVLVNNIATDETDNSGAFSVEVDLTGNSEQDKFSITLMDDSGNLSPATKVYITSSTENETDDKGEGESDGTFADTSGHWAAEYIQALYNLGAVNGYSATEFGPDKEITRAQILKIALLAFSKDVESHDDVDFNDVSSSAWYEEFVSTGYTEGIVQGYDDGTFRPDDPVTRAEAIKIILKAADLTVPGGDHDNFSDVSSGDWFSPYSGYAKELGFIGGYSDGSFRGNQSITRAEVCKIIVMVLEYLEQ